MSNSVAPESGNRGDQSDRSVNKSESRSDQLLAELSPKISFHNDPDNRMHSNAFTPGEIVGSDSTSKLPPLKGKESAFIPLHLAKDYVKKMESDMKSMHVHYKDMLTELEKCYSGIELDIHKKYKDFIQKYKMKMEDKCKSLKKAYDEEHKLREELRGWAEANVVNLQEKLKEEGESKKKALERLDSAINGGEKEKESLKKSLESDYLSQLDRAKADKAKAEASLALVSSKVRENTWELGRLIVEMITQRAEFIIFKDAPGAKDKSGKPGKSEADTLKASNLALKKEITSLREALSQPRPPAADPAVLKENEQLKQKIDKTKLKTQQMLASVTSERNNLANELNSLKQNLSAPSDSDDAETQMLKAQLAASSVELANYRQKLGQEEGKSAQLTILISSVAEKDKEISKLHEQLASIKPVLVPSGGLDPREKEKYEEEIQRLNHHIEKITVVSNSSVKEQKGDDKEKKDLRKDKQMLLESNDKLSQDIIALMQKIADLESAPQPQFLADPELDIVRSENEKLKKQVEELSIVPDVASKPGDNKEVKELKTLIKKLKKQNDFLKGTIEETKSDDLKILRESLDAANRKIQFLQDQGHAADPNLPKPPQAKAPKGPKQGKELKDSKEVQGQRDPDQEKRVSELVAQLAAASQEINFLKSQFSASGKQVPDFSSEQAARLGQELAEANARIVELNLLLAAAGAAGAAGVVGAAGSGKEKKKKGEENAKGDDSQLQAELAQLKHENQSLKAAAAQAGQVKLLQDELSKRPTPEELQKLNQIIKTQESQLKDLTASQGQQAKNLSEEIARLKQTLEISNKDNSAAMAKSSKEAADLQQRMQKQIDDLDLARSQLDKKLGSEIDSKAKMSVELEQVKKVAGEAAALSKRVGELTVQVAGLQEKSVAKEQELKESIRQRKLLHNQLEDLKGKIRVFCRVRPLSKSELDRGCHNISTIVDDFTITCESKNGIKPFVYDAVFGPNSSQDEVFEDTKRVVQSAVDGYNVCVFAYGQTGSGKTFTMTGVPGLPGVTPRAMDELFSVLNHLPSHYRWEVTCYMVELYLDNLVDLFLPKDQRGNAPALTIKKDTKGIVNVPEAVKIQVGSSKEIMARFDEGNLMRHTSSTKMNDSSSRSHLIFSVLIDVTNGETNQRTVGKLSLVDLAGSERVSKTEATAERLKEGRAINKSLTALGDVISALSSNESHIPYRNNKLTMLMSDSLGGTAKTLMFVNVSPANYNQEETTMSLFYASRVKLITNDPTKNIESKEMTVMKNELFSVTAERDKLRVFIEKKGFNPAALGDVSESRQEDFDDAKYDDL